MIIVPGLAEKLSQFETLQFNGDVFRVTPKSIIDPLTPSRSGGRWSVRNQSAVLYTSCVREGALAELSFHYSQITPPPSTPVCLHRIHVTTCATLRLVIADLERLGVCMNRYHSVNYQITQQIGAATRRLGYDGLLVPSARWRCQNLVLFNQHGALERRLTVLDSQIIDWANWWREHQHLADGRPE